MRTRVVLVGAGGHGRVVLDALVAAGAYEAIGFSDADSTRWGSVIDGVKVLGGDDIVDTLPADVLFVITLGSVRDSQPRQRLFDRFVASGRQAATVIHPRAVVSPRASIGDGTVVLANAVVGPGARIGANVIVNNGALVEHDCEVGAHVHVATGARLAGTVRVGSGTHVGAGATIIENVRVGAGAVIGAGAAVIRDVSDGTTVVGVPARTVDSRHQLSV